MKRIHLHGRLNDRQRYSCGNPGCYNRGSSYVRYGSGKMSSTIIHRGRILFGGLLAEVALIPATVPLGLGLGENSMALHCSPQILRRARRRANRQSQQRHGCFDLRRLPSDSMLQRQPVQKLHGMNERAPSSPISWMVQTLGWFSAEAAPHRNGGVRVRKVGPNRIDHASVLCGTETWHEK